MRFRLPRQYQDVSDVKLALGSWRDEPDDHAVFCEALHRDDDDKPLGLVIRFYEDAPTYAWVAMDLSAGRRISACSTDQAARSAVEQALGEVGSRGGRRVPGVGPTGIVSPGIFLLLVLERSVPNNNTL